MAINTTDKIRSNTPLIFFFFLLCGILVYLIYISTHVTMIDEDYTLFAKGESFLDVIKMCVNQYVNWNARMGDSMSILFSTIPIRVYGVLNAFAIATAMLLLMYITKLVIYREKITIFNWKDIPALLCVFLTFIFFVAQPNETLFWRTGAANYFYPVLFVLLYLIPVFKLIFQRVDIFKKIRNSSVRMLLFILYIPAGLIIGHSNENTAPVIVLLLLACVVYEYLTRRQFVWWLTLSLSMVAIGTALLLFGPSTQHRIEFYSNINNGHVSYVENIYNNFKSCISTYINFAIIPTVVVACFLVSAGRIKRTILVKILVVCLAISSISIIILMLSPYQIPRAYFFSSIILVIPVLACVYLVPLKSVRTLTSAVLVATLFSVPVLLEEAVNIKHFTNSKQLSVNSTHQQLIRLGQATIEDLSPYSSRLVYTGVPALEAQRIAEYFNYPKNSIVVRK